MDYSIQIDGAQNIVMVRATGALTRAGVIRMVQLARAEARARRSMPILYDIRHATLERLAKADIFWIARNSPALTDPKEARVRVGALFPEEQAALARFWEDTFQNAGVQARAFPDEQSALAWLRPQ